MQDAMIAICPRQLRAALILAAKHDARYYLNGVHVGATDKETRLHASDGHVACVQRFAAANALGGEATREFIVPRAVIEQALPLLKKAACASVLIEGGAYTLDVDGVRFPFAPIDGHFPNIRGIMGEGEAGEPAQFDPELLMRFRKAALALNPKRGDIYVKHRGPDRSAEVTLPGNPDFAGVIMPLRVRSEFAPESIAWAAA